MNRLSKALAGLLLTPALYGQTFDVMAHGAIPNDGNDDRAAIQLAVDSAITSGAPATVLFPNGSYHVAGQLTLTNAVNLTVEGSGSSLIFTDRTSEGLVAQSCVDLRFQNFVIKYEPLPFTQGRVELLDPGGTFLEVSIGDDYPDPDLDTHFRTYAGSLLAHDATTRKIKRGTESIYFDAGTPASPASNMAWRRFDMRNPVDWDRYGISVGDLCSIKVETYKSTLNIHDSVNTVVSGVTLFNSPSGALRAYECTGFLADGIQVVPANDALLSCTRDGLRFVNPLQGPTITNCTLIACGDDPIAIPSAFHRVVGPGPGTNQLLVLEMWHPLEQNRHIEMFEDGTFLSQGVYRILNRTGSSGSPATITLDAPPTDLYENAWITSLSHAGTGFYIGYNRIFDHRARGMLIKSSSGIIEGNIIDGSTHAGIAVGPEFNWEEGGFARDLIIRKNTIRNVGFSLTTRGPKSTQLGALSVHLTHDEPNWPTGRENRNITIQGNIIQDCGGAGLYLANADNVTVDGNGISNTHLLSTIDIGKESGLEGPYRNAIHVQQCGSVAFTGNIVTDPDTPPLFVSSTSAPGTYWGNSFTGPTARDYWQASYDFSLQQQQADWCYEFLNLANGDRLPMDPVEGEATSTGVDRHDHWEVPGLGDYPHILPEKFHASISSRIPMRTWNYTGSPSNQTFQISFARPIEMTSSNGDGVSIVVYKFDTLMNSTTLYPLPPETGRVVAGAPLDPVIVVTLNPGESIGFATLQETNQSSDSVYFDPIIRALVTY